MPLLEPIALPKAKGLPSISLYRYGGPLQDAVVRMKFGGRSDIARMFESDMRRGAACFAGLVDAVVPVPIHPRRYRERGFNQSVLLARPVAQGLALPLQCGLLRRVRHGAPRTKAAIAARHSSVGSFVGVARQAAPKRVLLVDDVRTTGATLRACALALRAAGVERVYSLTLAASG